jgi:transcriptional regulator with XRE-family HTH domain
MVIGERLRELRDQKKLSQGDIEKRTGLLRCYVSRVENGHTVPAVETLEKMARALEIPMYKLFYDGDQPAKAPAVFKQESSDDGLWGGSGKDAKYLSQLRRLMGKASEQDRKLLLHTLQKMAR